MERCKSCIHYDKKDSNENWVVCRGNMPVDVIINETSKDCENYVKNSTDN